MCIVYDNDGNGTVFVCGRGLSEAHYCRHPSCGALAEILCDYPVGEGLTCDRKLCREHAHQIGEEIDYCAHHWSEWLQWKAGGMAGAPATER